MISIGCYFVFTICVTATILSAHDINDDGELFSNDAQRN